MTAPQACYRWPDCHCMSGPCPHMPKAPPQARKKPSVQGYPFGYWVEQQMRRPRRKRSRTGFFGAIIFMIALYIAGAPIWAVIAFGNAIYTLDEIVLLLAADYAMKHPAPPSDEDGP